MEGLWNSLTMMMRHRLLKRHNSSVTKLSSGGGTPKKPRKRPKSRFKLCPAEKKFICFNPWTDDVQGRRRCTHNIFRAYKIYNVRMRRRFFSSFFGYRVPVCKRFWTMASIFHRVSRVSPEDAQSLGLNAFGVPRTSHPVPVCRR